MLDMPYFMTNKDWYEFDFKTRRFVLTENATSKAKESFVQYYKELEKMSDKHG